MSTYIIILIISVILMTFNRIYNKCLWLWRYCTCNLLAITPNVLFTQIPIHILYIVEGWTRVHTYIQLQHKHKWLINERKNVIFINSMYLPIEYNVPHWNITPRVIVVITSLLLKILLKWISNRYLTALIKCTCKCHSLSSRYPCEVFRTGILIVYIGKYIFVLLALNILLYTKMI